MNKTTVKTIKSGISYCASPIGIALKIFGIIMHLSENRPTSFVDKILILANIGIHTFIICEIGNLFHQFTTYGSTIVSYGWSVCATMNSLFVILCTIYQLVHRGDGAKFLDLLGWFDKEVIFLFQCSVLTLFSKL